MFYLLKSILCDPYHSVIPCRFMFYHFKIILYRVNFPNSFRVFQFMFPYSTSVENVHYSLIFGVLTLGHFQSVPIFHSFAYNLYRSAPLVLEFVICWLVLNFSFILCFQAVCQSAISLEFICFILFLILMPRFCSLLILNGSISHLSSHFAFAPSYYLSYISPFLCRAAILVCLLLSFPSPAHHYTHIVFLCRCSVRQTGRQNAEPDLSRHTLFH